MKTAIFDLETSGLYADTAILLCAVIKPYDVDCEPTILRADQYKTWRSNRSNTRPIVEAVMDELHDYDIFVAHNGQFFDKTVLTSWAVKFGLDPFLRFAKFIDPVMLARRHMRLSRRSLGNVLQFLDIPEEKTAILWKHWLQATMDGNSQSLGYIVDHCIQDVLVLEKAYRKMRKLVKGIDEKGSSL